MQQYDHEKRRVARYPKIPDHSDLRGFSYRAPTNYDWSDDHGSDRGPHQAGGSLDQAAKTSETLKRSFSFLGYGPKGYRRSDERVLEDVCEALTMHPGIDASQIEVTAEQGVVTLQGKVPDRWMKRAAEWVIDRISGVKDVRNLLTLENSGRKSEEDKLRLREIHERESLGSGLTPF